MTPRPRACGRCPSAWSASPRSRQNRIGGLETAAGSAVGAFLSAWSAWLAPADGFGGVLGGPSELLCIRCSVDWSRRQLWASAWLLSPLRRSPAMAAQFSNWRINNTSRNAVVGH